ncbi:MAG TPA: DUF1624 domain-containing protein [Clostridiaceae bacterium]|nr:DUF1624 domain-containing protein [Clostridiaceae bacterium]
MNKDQLYQKRIWELDFLRGLAVILMMYFHLIFDLNEFLGLNVSYLTGFNYLTGRMAAYIFIFVAGISCSLSRSNLKRGLIVFGYAMLITLMSYIFNPRYVVVFGVLHFFGASFLLYPLINKIPKNLIPLVGIIIIAAGVPVSKINVSHNFFAPLGLFNNKFYSSDYYPLIPYLGYFMIGIFLGKVLYKDKKSLMPSIKRDNIINTAGRHSLLLYLVHQPLFILIIYLVRLIIS